MKAQQPAINPLTVNSVMTLMAENRDSPEALATLWGLWGLRREGLVRHVGA